MKSLSREPIPLAYLPRSIRDGHFEDGLRHVDRDRRRLHADSSHPARCRRYATVARSCPLSRERSPFDHYRPPKRTTEPPDASYWVRRIRGEHCRPFARELWVMRGTLTTTAP